MKFVPTKIPDVIVIEPQVFGDERGFFLETYHQEKFRKAGLDLKFVQDNHSKSSKGILRGLHYQKPNPQGKLVRVISGEVYDVAVDMRQTSPTFGQWVGEYLSSDNKKMLWVPEGFAHGFYVTSESAEFVYKCTDFYSPADEHCLAWNDPVLNIQWPIPEGYEPKLSAKDMDGKPFLRAEYFL
ncbi:MAG: dTDP-4-dehydrorhamnose 3,5-epimerase [Gammaproteobacteria bacterium]|nr:dTDP-4-dehydrorhamnose 3,5-epimerase [Gammaproteobacteria bacterium]